MDAALVNSMAASLDSFVGHLLSGLVFAAMAVIGFRLYRLYLKGLSR
jgi:hypothetical protein